MGTQAEGARLVAKAWKDPAFKLRLLEDGNAAAEEMGIRASNHTSYTKFIVVENTEKV